MADLISRAAVKQAFIEYKNSMVYLAPLEINRLVDLFQLIKNLPSVDAAPVVHGRWIDHKDEHQCSECKEITIVDFYVWRHVQFDYCPYCGAKMDGERREGE